MAITNALSASSVDPSVMAKGIVDAERVPTIKRLDAKQADYSVKLSSLEQYKSYVADMQSKIPKFTDTSSVEDKIKSVQTFVDSYNKGIAGINTMSAYNPTTRTGGPLQGEGVTRSSTNQIKRETQFSEFGINVQRDGTLKIDDTKLKQTLNNTDATAKFTTSLKEFDSTLTSVLKDKGSLANKITSTTNSMNSIIAEKTKVNDRLATKEEQYYKQFTALNNLMNNFQATSNMLTQQFASLSKS